MLERLKDRSAEMFDCTKCQRHYRRDVRSGFRCGWIPQREWTEPKHRMLQRPINTPTPTIDYEVCPGYSTRLPAVHEVGCSYAWREKGQLQVRYPDGVDPQLVMLVDIFASAQSMAEQYYMDNVGD